MADAARSFIALMLCVERMSRERNELPIGFRASAVVKVKTSLFQTWKLQCHRVRIDNMLLSLSNYYSKPHVAQGIKEQSDKTSSTIGNIKNIDR